MIIVTLSEIIGLTVLVIFMVIWVIMAYKIRKK